MDFFIKMELEPNTILDLKVTVSDRAFYNLKIRFLRLPAIYVGRECGDEHKQADCGKPGSAFLWKIGCKVN